jgi:TetR/AcrR family transcriptional repressor of multidrug resistance operon
MRTRDKDKEALVKQAAIGMFVSEGMEGFSMNKLAKVCGISVATLYIYYRDKDDLIVQLAKEEARRMADSILGDFDPAMGFEEGLRFQWKSRAKFAMENIIIGQFFDQLRNSTYREEVFQEVTDRFREPLGKFMKNAIARREIDPMPLEVYWSVAFAPLYNLIKFSTEGRSIGGKPFNMNNKILWQTFELVLKALKK